MIDFKELKVLIQKASIVDRTDISSRFKFSIETDKLEQILNNQKTDLHVLGAKNKIESRVPTTDDIQLISEYIYKEDQFYTIFNGESQIACFMLYCDKEGTVKITDDGKAYDILNGDKIDIDVVNNIIATEPVYRVLVVRKFNIKEDKFDYAIFFRSNRNMINYIKDLKEEGGFDQTEDTKETE